MRDLRDFEKTGLLNFAIDRVSGIRGGKARRRCLLRIQALLVSAGMLSSAMALDLRTWTSLQWGSGMDAKLADIAAHGVEVVEAPPWNAAVTADALRLCRKHGLKAFTYTIDYSKSSKAALASNAYERAVMLGGAYRGLAIDRHVFSFSPAVHDIVVEPPVYSKGQPYGSGKTKSGHYFGGRAPVRAEVVVPLKPFDGEQHLAIVPCAILPVAAGTQPENDTATEAMRATDEFARRKLVRLRFDLSPYAGAMLDKVGVAVYWASDVEGASWRDGNGQMSVFAESTRAASVRSVESRLGTWMKGNGGTFPSDVLVAIRFGDECFNVTGWLDCPAASYPVYGYSESGLAAFRRLAPGLEPPRTWGFPEIYGEQAYGAFLYNYHKGCADLTRAVVEAAHRIAPDLKVFRNTTRADAWSYVNDHDGSGQELLARELDFLHLDPYPVAKGYDARTIPFDMGYFAGLARRLDKPLVPWLQAHAYAPCGLAHVTPEQVARMWEQHRAFAPDGIMWLGYGAAGGGITCTFPAGNPASWEKAAEIHHEIRSAPPARKPVAKLAVLRPYRARALVNLLDGGAVRNPADVLLGEYVKAWSVDHGRAYDVFEIPPFETAAERAAREAELEKYEFLVSTLPHPRAKVVGSGTAGQVYARARITAARTAFRQEIAALDR